MCESVTFQSDTRQVRGRYFLQPVQLYWLVLRGIDSERIIHVHQGFLSQKWNVAKVMFVSSPGSNPIGPYGIYTSDFGFGIFPGGGGGTWVFRGAHTLVIKIKKYP